MITDLSASRLEFAKSIAPEVKTLMVDRSWSPKELAEKIKELAGTPGGVSCAIEATGVESSVQAAIFVSFFYIFFAREWV